MRPKMESFGMFTLCIDVEIPMPSACSGPVQIPSSKHLIILLMHILTCNSTVKQLYKAFSLTYMHSSAL